jgi:hypothetical protein
MTRTRLAILLIAAACCGCSPCRTVAWPDTGGPGQLEMGRLVRIDLADGRRFEGRAVAASAESLTVAIEVVGGDWDQLGRGVTTQRTVARRDVVMLQQDATTAGVRLGNALLVLGAVSAFVSVILLALWDGPLG